MTDKRTIEIFICMNEDGDCEVAVGDPAEASARLDEQATSYAKRIAMFHVHMSPPSYDEPAAVVDIPDDAGETVGASVEERA